MDEFPKRKTTRLKEYDYSAAGYYFVTVCAQDKEHIFGKVVNGAMVLNDAGEIARFAWMDLMRHNINIELDEFIVMPNHMHGIINIVVVAGSKPARIPAQTPITKMYVNNNDRNKKMTDFNEADLKLDWVVLESSKAGLEPAPTGHGLPEIVRQFKTFSAKRINDIRQMPGKKIWQRSFYDHIIRNEKSLQEIREYIVNNPAKWNDDEYNVE